MLNESERSNLRITAYHEAGHAVAHHVLGGHVIAANVFPENHRAGVELQAFTDWKGREVKTLGTSEVTTFWTSWHAMRCHELLRSSLRAEVRRNSLELIRRQVVMTLAGPFAEARHLGRGRFPRTCLDFPISDDMAQVESLLGDYHALTGRRPLLKFGRQAVQLVRDNYAAIDSVAVALMDRHRLTGEELAEIVHSLTG